MQLSDSENARLTLIQSQIVVYRRLTSPLARLPGPEISNWTELVYSYYWLTGKAPMYVHQLHEKYGE